MVSIHLKLLSGLLLLLGFSCLHGFPADVIERLSDDVFKEREAAQAELLEWADKSGEAGLEELFGLWETSEDPEIRERVVQVLRSLSTKMYHQGGRPYLGVSMTEKVGEAEKEGSGRVVIIVTEILKGSPAASSDLQPGDVIVSKDGVGWSARGAVNEFSESIAEMKPGSSITLLIERAELKPFEVKVTLRRCPVPLLMPGMGDLGRLETMAEEAFFREWFAEEIKLRN